MSIGAARGFSKVVMTLATATAAGALASVTGSGSGDGSETGATTEVSAATGSAAVTSAADWEFSVASSTLAAVDSTLTSVASTWRLGGVPVVFVSAFVFVDSGESFALLLGAVVGLAVRHSMA